MKKILNWKLGLIIVILLATFLRLWQLGNVPSGTPNDEASYIYNSYSIWHTGKDIESRLLPLSFNAHSSQSPVQVYITAPFVGILGLSLFTARLPAALIGIGSVFFLFLLTDLLFKNKRISVLSAFLLAISPWALQIGRGLWDANFALFFFIVGIYTFIKYVGTNKIFWSIVPLFLGFYSYHATKVYFVFLIPALIFVFRKELLKKKRALILFLLGCFFILLSFLVVTKTQSITRQGEVYLLGDTVKASKTVNWEREYNSAPWIIRSVFSNKPLYFLKAMRENYLGVFSTEFLFINGELGAGLEISNILYRGEFYIIEFPLLLLGIFALYKNKNTRLKKLLLALLLISPLPSLLTVDKNFVNRNIMLLPVLLIVIAIGIDYFLNNLEVRKNIIKYSLLTIFILFYLFLFSEYFYQYYYRWTVYGAEGWQNSYKDLAYIVSSNKSDYDNIYIGKTPKEFLLQYAIFNKVDPKLVQKAWNQTPIKLYNLTLFKDCVTNNVNYITKSLPKSTLYAAKAGDCYYKLSTPSTTIVDKGEPLHVIWNIYENK